MPDDLDPDSADPLFAQLANRLRERIRNGTYPVRLPSEPALGAEFGVSRDTVRRAIFLLSQERLVQVSPGRGTFVIRDSRQTPGQQG
jgi:DNA-binding GntR family transcriptional regulator